MRNVALPFPPSDGLYGFAPDPAEDFGIRQGTVAARGILDRRLITVEAKTDDLDRRVGRLEN